MVILAGVVMYKAVKKERSVTDGMMRYDVNRTSRAPYMTMHIDKNSVVGRFGKCQASLSK